jgi:flagellar protein FlgJ
MSFIAIGPTNGVPIRSTAASNAGGTAQNDETRLKKSALQLEGLFVQRLFAAMRETVPDDCLVSQSNAESTFTEMLDDRLSQQVPEQFSGAHSLAQALYEQLRRRLEPPAAQHTGSDTQR